MKIGSRFMCAGVGAVLASAGLVNATVIGTDSFDYADGSLNGQNGGSGWVFYNSNPDVPTSWWGGGSVENLTMTTSWSNITRNFGDTQSEWQSTCNWMHENVVYFAVDLTLNDSRTKAIMASMDFGNTGVEFGAFGGDSATWAIWARDAGYYATDIAVTTGAIRIVGSIQWGSNGLLKMWINPDGNDFDNVRSKDSSADVIVDYNGNKWSTSVRLWSEQYTGQATWDNLIVATTFDEANVHAVPEPASLGLLAGAGLLLMRRR